VYLRNKTLKLTVLPQAEYMKYVSVPWLLLEAAPSIVNVSFFVKNIFFENEWINKNKRVWG